MLAVLSLTLLSTWLLPAAQAGELLIEAEAAAEVQVGTTLLARTWGPARLRVVELDPGVAQLRVLRGDRTDLLDVEIPNEGAAVLRVAAQGLSTEPTEEEGSWPVLELRASVGQRFGVVLDGNRLGVIGHAHPVRVEGISPGQHHLELRTDDLTVVWARGDLELKEDDLLVVTGIEGYAPLVSGRDGAFRLAGAATRKGASGSGAGD